MRLLNCKYCNAKQMFAHLSERSSARRKERSHPLQSLQLTPRAARAAAEIPSFSNSLAKICQASVENDFYTTAISFYNAIQKASMCARLHRLMIINFDNLRIVSLLDSILVINCNL